MGLYAGISEVEEVLNHALANMPKEAIGVGDVAHGVWDAAGVIPGVGEFFDGAHALWYIEKGDYLSAAFSLISMIPLVGDVVGKGGKLGVWLMKNAPKGSAAAVKYGPKIRKLKGTLRQMKPAIDQGFAKAQENEMLAPHIGKLQSALSAFVGQPDIVDSPGAPPNAQDITQPAMPPMLPVASQWNYNYKDAGFMDVMKGTGRAMRGTGRVVKDVGVGLAQGAWGDWLQHVEREIQQKRQRGEDVSQLVQYMRKYKSNFS